MIEKIVKYIIQQDKEYQFDIRVLNNVLSRYGLLSLLPKILIRLQKAQDIQKQKSNTTILSPFELNQDLEKQIQQIFQVNTTKTIISKDVLAGFKAYNADKILDMSLSSLIKKL